MSSGFVPVEDFGQPGVLTVSRSGGSDDSFPVVVEFAMSGSAQQDVDYYLQDESGNWLGSWVEIPAYATSVDILWQPINDAETEQGEWVEMSLTRAAAFSGGCGFRCSVSYELHAADPPTAPQLVLDWEHSERRDDVGGFPMLTADFDDAGVPGAE